MFKKVLVAIDGSKMTDKVLEAAKTFAQSNETKLTLVYVGKELVIPPNVIITDYERILSEMTKAGHELLAEAKQKLEAEGVAAETLFVQSSSISRVIVNVACDQHYDLIVIGSRGLGNIKEVMLGGVSHKVTQLSKCPVLIIK